ncbi:uncharacterized protein LOC125228593 isoform X2 [Leguminivora glycinivorella]|nr:uncharacterized protein LOC125228593 isoform X2 [Leguminivora glycinivorella]XP_047989176.1 uncharacterized protein LOC125228593 isoform X2 [Leguminivora glycinivorella]
MAGISRNPEAVQEYQLLISQLIKNPSSLTMICCVDEEEGPQIVGVSLMSLIAVERQDLFRTSQPKTDEMRLYLKLEEIFDLRNKMKELQIASFYDDIGLIVHSRFRKLGIASELVKARYMACVAHNVAAIGASLTSLGTEKMAQKNHWHTVKQVRLDELGQHCGATCFDAAVNTIRLVIWKNPEFRTH